MLESLRVRPAICKRIRSGPLGVWVDPFIAALAQQGYAPSVQRRSIRAAAVFGAWMTRHRITAVMVDEAMVARFSREHRRWQSTARPRGRMNGLVTGVRSLAAYLWAQGVAVRQTHPTSTTDLDRWVTKFDEHLTRVRGVSCGTRRIYGRYARTLLTTCWPNARADWSTFTADRLIGFVREQAATLSRSASRAPVTATRSFVRFLIAEGVVRSGLDGIVPGVRQWKLATLPNTLTKSDVQRVMETLDTSTVNGVRDHAILLLLSRLGLRAGEVAALRLSDIDWREGCVHIRPGKTGRERRLPLSQDVGAALVHTLKACSAGAARDTLFVRARPPYRPLTASAVTGVAQRVLRRADVALTRRGAHAFRHTVASQLVQQGVSMKAVADVLGHAELATTAIYAKLDVATLQMVALPWPEDER
jgi:site-specific recombinase XerD